jgi:DNA primase large subunit
MFRQGKRRILERNNYTAEVSRHVEYPFRLNMYDDPPLAEITLDQFEQWAIDRIRVLGELDSCLQRNKTPKDTQATMKPLLDKYLPLSFGGSGKDPQEERKKDHYSHFILRLVFSRSPELRDKFCRLETALFRLRFSTEDVSDRKNFVNSLNFDWESVEDDERQELASLLAAATPQSLEDQFFKVDFERVIDLVDQRKVFLRRGKAYVPMSFQQSLVGAEFTQRLSKALIASSRALPRLGEDTRLIPILNQLSKGFDFSDYQSSSNVADGIRAEMIDSLEKQGHFPLCMRTMHRGLRHDGHAKHNTRQQYGLFLKGIGLSVDEALKFWRTSFKKVTDDQFQKNYRYNVRHQYGLEGGRINYKPMGCLEITRTSATPGETHGCPYRQFTPDNLAAALNDMGINDRHELNGIKDMVDKKNYHLACTRVYELTHPDDNTEYEESIRHPNSYFERSYLHAQKKLTAASQGSQ